MIDNYKSNYLEKLGRAIDHGGQLSPKLMYLIIRLLKHHTCYPPKSLYPLASMLNDLGIIKDAQTNDIDWSFNLTYKGKKITERICPRYRCTSVIIWLLDLFLFEIPIILIVILGTFAYFYMIHQLYVSDNIWYILACSGMITLIYVLLMLSKCFSKARFIRIAQWMNNPDPAPVYKMIFDSPRWYLLNQSSLKILSKDVDVIIKYGLTKRSN